MSQYKDGKRVCSCPQPCTTSKSGAIVYISWRFSLFPKSEQKFSRVFWPLQKTCCCRADYFPPEILHGLWYYSVLMTIFLFSLISCYLPLLFLFYLSSLTTLSFIALNRLSKSLTNSKNLSLKTTIFLNLFLTKNLWFCFYWNLLSSEFRRLRILLSFLKLLIFVICLLLIIFVGIDNIWFSLLFSFCILIVFHVSIGAFYLQSPPILQTPTVCFVLIDLIVQFYNNMVKYI